MKVTQQSGRGLWVVTAGLAVVACLTVGCAEKGVPAGGAPSAEMPSHQDVPSGYSAEVSEAEATAFAERLEEAFEAKDKGAIDRLIDWRQLAARACVGFPLAKAELDGMKSGLARGMSNGDGSNGGFVFTVFQQCSNRGEYSFVRAGEKDEMRSVLFRLTPSGGGMNYHTYVLVRDSSGNVVASDVYVQASAEFLSETTRKLLFVVLADRPDSFLDRLTGVDREWLANSDTFAAMSGALAKRQPAEVLRLYNTLPKTMQQSKAALLIKIMAAQQVDEEQYVAAMQAFRRYYPTDSALSMMLMDYYFLKGDYDKALKAIDDLDAAVQDTYINLLRANGYFAKEDYPTARKYIDLFVADFPESIDGHDVQASIALKQGDFPAVTNALKILHSQFGIDMVAVTSLPVYAPYKKSAEYEKLMEYIKENPTPST